MNVQNIYKRFIDLSMSQETVSKKFEAENSFEMAYIALWIVLEKKLKGHRYRNKENQSLYSSL